MSFELWLMRHGETEWSLFGQHTSRTDLPLIPQGRERAEKLRRLLAGKKFALVLSSPMRRALETAHLAGFEPEIDPDLNEWQYGDYEGLTTAQIRQKDPDWTIWTKTPPGGETAEHIAMRADRVIARAESAGAEVAVFGHGHMLRVLAARWLGLDASAGKYFALSTGSISILGFEHNNRVLQLWNRTPEMP